MANSPRPCFIDTNIWLYAFIETEASKSALARKLLQEINPVVSTQVINEVCINLLRQANFTETQIRRLIQAFYQKYRVVELTETVLLRASQLRERYSLSFWDSTIAAAALSVAVPVLYSEDMQDGLTLEEQVQVRNPFASL